MESSDAEVVLASPAARRVLDLILATPGVAVSELARRAGMPWSSAFQHVERLERVGLVRSLRVGRRRVLFSARLLDSEAPDVPAILGEPACALVARAILAQPGQRVWQLCETTQMTERAVYHHVQRLVASGLVMSKKPDLYVGLAPSPLLMRILGEPADDA